MPLSPVIVRRGFTLIELLIVVVIIGLLAAIAIPKFTNTKGKSYAGTMKSDLRNLAGQQESYYSSNERYASTLGQAAFNGSPGVTVTINEATGTGWSAVATHPSASPVTCSVFYGTAAPVAPAVTSGAVFCQ